MADSFLFALDDAMRQLAFTKFGTNMGVTSADDVILCPKDIAQRYYAEHHGKAEAEFINVHCVNTGRAPERWQTSAARRGFNTMYVDESTKAQFSIVKAMPVNLDYGIWLWSKRLDRIKKCVEDYIFWQHVNPKLTLMFNDVYPQNMNLHFDDPIDETEYANTFDAGILYVWKFMVRLEGWVYKLSTARSVLKIVLNWYLDVEGGDPILLSTYEFTTV